LEELKVLNKPNLLVLNQCDLLDNERRRDLEMRFPGAIFTSALTGEGLDDLKERIFGLLDEEAEEITLKLPAEREETGRILSELARHGRILHQDFAPGETGEHPILCVQAKLAKRWFELVGVEEYVS
jgi:GTP-binding protein HflX